MRWQYVIHVVGILSLFLGAILLLPLAVEFGYGGEDVAAFGKDTERPERTRLGGASPESLTPAELLERYLESRDTTAERTKTLLEYAEEILSPVD